ncbi:hypothetical protein GCM10023340_17290 [Nocardioides marinquilinus]|uniref:DUF559 domain-containing protein n=1 Tax=Nocardioides marinquilinus TaxID=1210400 RepID=A0ABP9PH00_9ACTN
MVERNGLLVMSGTRTALEVTTVAPLDPSVVVVSHLLNLGHTTEDQLLAHYGRMAEWPGSGKTDLVLRLADARFDSIGETRTYLMLFRAHIDMPEPQYKIHDDGVLVAELDFAWPDLGVWLEFDGFVKYQKLLEEGESASEVVVREKRREDLVRRLTGWECIRLTWADLSRPERTAAMIQRVLDGRRAAA